MALILQSLIHLVHFDGNTCSTSSQTHMKVFKTLRSGPERGTKAKSWSCIFLLGVELCTRAQGLGWDGVGWGCAAPKGRTGSLPGDVGVQRHLLNMDHHGSGHHSHPMPLASPLLWIPKKPWWLEAAGATSTPLFQLNPVRTSWRSDEGIPEQKSIIPPNASLRFREY